MFMFKFLLKLTLNVESTVLYFIQLYTGPHYLNNL